MADLSQEQRDIEDFATGTTYTRYVILIDGVEVAGTLTDDLTTSDNMYANILANSGVLVPIATTVLQSDTI